jgi:hypothetical protein
MMKLGGYSHSDMAHFFTVNVRNKSLSAFCDAVVTCFTVVTTEAMDCCSLVWFEKQ